MYIFENVKNINLKIISDANQIKMYEQIELKLFYADKINPGFWALFEGKELKKGSIVQDKNSTLHKIKV